MRPVRLEVSGFGAFRDDTTVDFEGTDFFALVGPTGSGKSTVIDAICFALYGCVPRYEDRRMVSPIVSTGALEAKVSLVFEVGGERFHAARVVRLTKSGAPKSDARLERVADGEVLAGRVSEMEDAVLAVLGLPYAHFIKCVVLPQGEFARFLHDKPADRQQLLVELLNLDVYTRMGQDARALAAQRDAEIGIQGRRLEELAALLTDEHRATVAERLDACRRLTAELQAARATLEQLTNAIADAEREVQHATELGARLRAVQLPSEIADLATQHRAADAGLVVATKSATDASAAVKQQSKAVAQLPDLAVLVAARDAHRDLAALAKDAAAQDKAGAAAAARVVELEAELAAAEARRDDAAAAQEALRNEHRAHMVAATLRAGEPCPVCAQVVAKVPARRAPAGVKRVDDEVKRATDAHAKVAKALEQARIAAGAAQRGIEGLAARTRDLAARVEAYPDADATTKLIATVEAADTALDRARRDEDAARRELDRARALVDSFAGRSRDAAARLRAQREPLLQHGAVPPEMRDDLLADWRALEEWAAPEAEVAATVARVAQERANAQQSERRALLTGLVEACAGLDIAVPSPVAIDGLLDAATRAQLDAEHESNRVTAAAGEEKTLRKEVAASTEAVAVAKLLGQLLRASEFERWLVSEALELLVADASRTLLELSAGHYSLALDETGRDFVVVDHRNAGEQRSVRTLSGGETFQASLALALALSDHLRQLATDGAARLESIFLDEGFGSLDPDTLETVASTIETLAVGDRMVGLVTHVAELSERVPVRFVVSAGPRSSSVEKVLS